MPARRYVEEVGSVAMLATKRLAGVAPEVKLGEYTSRTLTPSMNKAEHSSFETQMRHHQKSKTGISGPTKKTDLLPQKNFLS